MFRILFNTVFVLFSLNCDLFEIKMRSPLDDVESQGTEQKSGSLTTKVLTVIGSLAAVGFVAVTTYQNAGSNQNNSESTTNLDNTMRTFDGKSLVPVYGSLDEDTQSGLFSEFSNTFNRVVSSFSLSQLQNK
jgi:hypothetical protein